MKKFFLILMMFAFVFFEAKTCSFGCASNGSAWGYGWTVSNNSTCTATPPIGATVHEAYVAYGGSKHVLIMVQAIENFSQSDFNC